MRQKRNLTVVKERGVALITVSRPALLNALSRETLIELSESFRAIDGDSSTSVIILTGEGNRAFCAGADINDLANVRNMREYMDFIRLGNRVFVDIQNTEKPTIAAVNGYAVGAGCELVMACDMAIAAEHAKFGFPEINIGAFPSGIAASLLSKLVGVSRAKELIFTGQLIDAKEAWRIGLVNRLTAGPEMMREVISLAKELADKPKTAIRLAKSALNHICDMTQAGGLEYAEKCGAILFDTEDFKIRSRAFLEKRNLKDSQK
ncbi:MAG: enoyl-CoA hydratase/isomerase family protein [Planctomycetes bacterium]|nr:enoyl-CoA hydratase/isomerase family protein [Planctomycetota bacterium]